MSSPSGSDCESQDIELIGDECDFQAPSSSQPTPPRSPHKLGLSVGGRRRVRTTSTSHTSAGDGPIVRSGKQAIFTAGRPPWYNSHGQLKEAFVIGICGGSASGKTTVARKIIEALNVQWVSLVSMDSFYKTLNEEQHERAIRNEYDFDCPEAFDTDLIAFTLRRLKEGKSVDIPVYNFTTHRVENYKKTIYGANVVIFEGILAFEKKEIRDIMDMKVFVDTDSDIRLARRLKRDITERGRDLDGVIKQYHKYVKPAYDHYIEPSRTHADVIVPRGGENLVAINLIVIHVHQKLQERGFKVRLQLKQEAHDGQPLPHTLHTLDKTNQVIGLHTFIRNKETTRDEFIFYSKRLMRLLIEYALSLLPFKIVTVETPQGQLYEGMRINTGKICGVSILRAGETLEPALCDVCKDVSLGKILIQTNLDSGEPELHYLRLPKDIKDHYVMLMDATMATGAAAMMAIRVLLDHDVPQENILLLSLIMAVSGVHAVAYAFPKVNLVTTEVDQEINDLFHILPGIGNFGDRYFGTEPAVVDDFPVFQ